MRALGGAPVRWRVSRRDEDLDHLRARRDRLAHEIDMMANDIAHWNRSADQPIDADEFLAAPRAVLADIDRKIGLAP